MRWWGVFVVLLLAGCSFKEETKEVGHKGIARVNPYLAAQRFLREYGFVVREDRGWPELDYSLGMAMVPASVLSAEGYVADLSNWVEDGGHAVILLERGESHISDWNEGGSFGFWFEPEESDPLDRWVQDLGWSLKNGLDDEDESSGREDPTPPVRTRTRSCPLRSSR